MEPSNALGGAPEFDGHKAEIDASELLPNPSSNPATSQVFTSPTTSTLGREPTTATATINATKALPSSPLGTPYPIAPAPKRPRKRMLLAVLGVGAIAQVQAQVKNTQLQLSYTRITAPTAGRVGNKTVEVGQRLQPGQTLMAVVQDQPWIIANFKETQLGKMKPGQDVEIKIDLSTCW
ncbi:HlyD family secretion protein [Scytonema sp. HK-05]|uniref:HlyD family secretion protein n=1 Tax=Scytonema sp. HK-05 TaxID=1137095 RepID=UPI0009FABDB5|nr:HlyD family secretion protein [Scytonema sp. HK-05]